MAQRRLRPDTSAEKVAAARSLSLLEDPVPVRNPDDLAPLFLGLAFTAVRVIPPLRRAAHRAWERRIPGICGSLNARTHHIDRVLVSELSSGAEQVVILGAGYDTRAHRFHHVLAGRPVFEVDMPGTQARKRRQVRRVPADRRGDVTYVACDVSRPDLWQVLGRAGYSPTRRTVLVWEGMSYYLANDAVDQVLHGASRASGPGSVIVFDYLYRGVLDDPGAYPDSRGAVRYLQRHRIPYRSGLPEGTTAAHLAARGWELESDLDPLAMAEAYLRRVDGTLHAEAFVGYGMATARRLG